MELFSVFLLMHSDYMTDSGAYAPEEACALDDAADKPTSNDSILCKKMGEI